MLREQYAWRARPHVADRGRHGRARGRRRPARAALGEAVGAPHGAVRRRSARRREPRGPARRDRDRAGEHPADARGRRGRASVDLERRPLRGPAGAHGRVRRGAAGGGRVVRHVARRRGRERRAGRVRVRARLQRDVRGGAAAHGADRLRPEVPRRADLLLLAFAGRGGGVHGGRGERPLGDAAPRTVPRRPARAVGGGADPPDRAQHGQPRAHRDAAAAAHDHEARRAALPRDRARGPRRRRRHLSRRPRPGHPADGGAGDALRLVARRGAAALAEGARLPARGRGGRRARRRARPRDGGRLGGLREPLLHRRQRPRARRPRRVLLRRAKRAAGPGIVVQALRGLPYWLLEGTSQ